VSPRPTPPAEYVAAYSHSSLDRATSLRTDPAWRSSLLGGDLEVLVLRCGRCLVDDDHQPVVLVGDQARALMSGTEEPMLLGLSSDRAGRAGRAVFAVDLKGLDEAEATRRVGAASTIELREIVTRLDGVTASRLAYARGLSIWHDHARFCGICGNPTTSTAAGHARTCTGTACGELHFPRISPAVIVLVESPGPPARCLLGRHRQSRLGGYSTLAGFVEIGESLEEAVRREVAEEAGVKVGQVTYQGSQAWPFPSGIMVAFRALALDDAVQPDGEELVEARWFTRAELSDVAATSDSRLGRSDSIDRMLLEGWLGQA
jgi:NAD+ diphosphatase